MTPKSLEKIMKLSPNSSYRNGFDDGVAATLSSPEFKAVLEALSTIDSNKNQTRLAMCCVQETCLKHHDTNTCSFQTGVNYGYSDQAEIAIEALTAFNQWVGK